ncbi:hypothetical protein [Actinoallomurus sp. CA-142502]|uniref:hypothetical protein n=1 Tax=Actinoallomurus sp. CA-142502 TaxID=3239885 RepID=UPI003D921716
MVIKAVEAEAPPDAINAGAGMRAIRALILLGTVIAGTARRLDLDGHRCRAGRARHRLRGVARAAQDMDRMAPAEARRAYRIYGVLTVRRAGWRSRPARYAPCGREGRSKRGAAETAGPSS